MDDHIYPTELEIKYTTSRFASHLHLHLEIDIGDRLRTTFYGICDDANCLILNYQFICSISPPTPAYGLYISLSSYHIQKLVIFIMIPLRECCYQQARYYIPMVASGQVKVMTTNIFTVATMIWLTGTEYRCYKWPRICSVCGNHNPVLSSFISYDRICKKNSWAGCVFHSGSSAFARVVLWGSCFLIHVLSFLCSVL